MSKIIEITVSPTGETKLETKGFSGESCRDAGNFLLEALGEKTSEQRTAEYYATATASDKVHLRPTS